MDGLRGLAALGVLVLHVWMFTGRRELPRGEPIAMAIGELRLGLILFFVLSGFLLARPWVVASLDGGPRPGLRRFAVRRLARIAPGYWLAMLGAFGLLLGSGHRTEVALGDLPIFALFAQNYVEHAAGRLDPPMWSLVVEVSFYAVLPLIGWLLLRARGRGRMVACCAALIALGLAWTAAGELREWPRTAMATLPVFLPAFACGIAACAIAHGRRPSPAWTAAIGAAGVAAVLANAAWHSDGTALAGHVLRDLPAAAGFAAIVAAVALRPPRVLCWAPIRGLGTVSYGVYLWHMPILIWLRVQGHLPDDDVLGGLARVLVPTMAVALASWYLVERPVLRAVERRLPRARHERRRGTAPTGSRRPAPQLA